MKDIKVYYPYPATFPRVDEFNLDVVYGTIHSGAPGGMPAVGMRVKEEAVEIPLFAPADGTLRILLDGSDHLLGNKIYACLLLQHRDDPQLESRFYGTLTVNPDFAGGVFVRAGQRIGRVFARGRSYRVNQAGGSEPVDGVWLLTRKAAEPSPYALAYRFKHRLHPDTRRFWERPDVNPPLSAPGPALYPALAAALRREEWSTAREKFEYASAFEVDGSPILVHYTSFEEGVVRLPEEQRAMMVDSVFTHNHPGGCAFSLQDLRAAAAHNMAEIRAVSEEEGEVFVYRLLRPGGAWPDLSLMKRPNTYGDDDLLRLIAEEKVSLTTADVLWYAMSMLALAKRLGIPYYREKLR